jgi:hypothetical protein
MIEGRQLCANACAHALSQDLKPLRLKKSSRLGVEIAHVQFDLGNTFRSREFL